MTITQATRRIASVTVEYDSRGARATKSFDNPYAARRFYVQKDREGRNPKIKGVTR